MNDRPDPLDRFGQFLMQHLRDQAIGFYDDLARHHCTTASLARLQDDLAMLDGWQQAIVRRCVMRVVDAALHDFLSHLQDEADNDGDIELIVGGVNVGRISHGLHADLFGWTVEYSVYGASPLVP